MMIWFIIKTPPSSYANESNLNLAPSWSEPIDPSSSGSEIDPHGNDMRSDESQLRRSNRRSVPRRRFDIEVVELFTTLLQEENEPNNVKEALSTPLKDGWIKAMEYEMESMKVNKVWELANLLGGCKAIRNKWALKLKHKTGGTVERHKARLVAKGYTQ